MRILSPPSWLSLPILSITLAVKAVLPAYVSGQRLTVPFPNDEPIPRSYDKITFHHVGYDWIDRADDKKKIDPKNVTEVMCTGSIDIELMNYIATFPSVKKIMLVETRQADLNAIIEPLTKMKSLTTLEIGLVEFQKISIPAVSEIRSLEVLICDCEISIADLNRIAKLPELRSLDISLGEVSGDARLELGFPKLEDLKLYSKEDVRIFSQLGNRLKRLSISDTISLEDAKGLMEFAELQSLKVGVEDPKVFETLFQMTNLDEIKVYRSAVAESRFRPQRD